MGGTRRRSRGQRRRPQPAATPPRGRPPRSGWRGTLDSWGGLPVVGSVVGALVLVAALIIFTRPGASVGTGEFLLRDRANVDGRAYGDPAAPVRMIEFADFQCPFCRLFAEGVGEEIAERYIETGVVRAEFHHFSFIGPESTRAAEAAECASDQGHFWDYHDLLFLRQGAENAGVFSTSNLKDFARELRDAVPAFDVETFDECLESGRKRALVEQLTEQARQSGIQTTPTFLFNGIMVAGAEEIEVFEEAIERARAVASGN